MRRPTAVAVVLGALMLALPGAASAGSLDATSTATFVSAATRAEHIAIARVGREKASADALIEHVESKCPGSVPASLATGTLAQQLTLGAFEDAATFELGLAEVRPLRSVARIEFERTAPLRWTSADLNRRVAVFVREGREVLALHTPDLCAQARTAAQSGFTVVPALTRAFIARFQRASPDSAPTDNGLAQRMKPFATLAELEAIKRLNRLDAKFGRLITNFAFRALGQVEHALTGAVTP